MAVPVSKPVLVASSIQLVAALGLVLLLFFEWVLGGRTGLEGNGGGGFGVLALITAVVTIYAAGQGLRGRRSARAVIGANQLAIALAIGLFLANAVFLWVFRTGGAPKWVYPAANVLIYSGVVGLFADRPEQAKPLPQNTVRVFGAIAAVLGLAIALSPALDYTDLGSRTLTGYQPGSPRVGIALLIIGGVVVFVGVQRAWRGTAMNDAGPYVLWPHVMMGLGIIATAVPFAWVVSGVWGDDFDPAIGAYLSLLAGAGLIALGAVEAVRRDAPGI